MKLFLATPASMSDEKATTIRNQLSQAIANDKIEIVLAADDYRENFAELGGWAPWIMHVSTGVDYMTRKPVYEMIICVQRFVGKATHQIVQQALHAGKIVGLFADGTIHTVRGVRQVDGENWVDGWEIVT